MRPADGARVTRKGLRQAKRGEPGRRHAREVVVTYGHRLRQQDWYLAWTGDEAARHRYFTFPAGRKITLEDMR